MLKKQKWISNKTIPPKNTLIQFIVKVSGKYGEYWGEYDGIYHGYVSAEMPFPQDFTIIYAWKITELSIIDGKLSYVLNKKIEKKT